jgi:hypothetical protein
MAGGLRGFGKLLSSHEINFNFDLKEKKQEGSNRRHEEPLIEKDAFIGFYFFQGLDGPRRP